MSGTPRKQRAPRVAIAWKSAVALAVLIGLTGVVLDLSARPAAAAEHTVCQTGTLARQRTEINADIPVQQFDPTLGTLLEVTAQRQAIHLDTDSRFENIAPQSQIFAEQMQYNATFTAPAGLASPPVIAGTVQRVPAGTPFGAFDGTLDFAGASSFTQPSTTRDGSAPALKSRDPAILAAFSGSGTVAFHLTTLISEVFTGGGGNVAAQINTFAAADVEVCYLYSVPDTIGITAPPRFAG